VTELVSVPAVFAMGFVTEMAYVSFVRASVAGRALAAALWCGVLVALGWVALAVMIQFTWFLALPGLAGHSLGTYMTVRRVAREA
jgi:hypothetical protein